MYEEVNKFMNSDKYFTRFSNLSDQENRELWVMSTLICEGRPCAQVPTLYVYIDKSKKSHYESLVEEKEQIIKDLLDRGYLRWYWYRKDKFLDTVKAVNPDTGHKLSAVYLKMTMKTIRKYKDEIWELAKDNMCKANNKFQWFKLLIRDTKGLKSFNTYR